MLIAPPRAPEARVKRLAAKLYAYSFLDDFVLLYPVYSLLFADTGLSTAEISSLFVIWSLTGFLLEVPSGVWADVVSRRLLLVAGPLLTAVGYGPWVAVPSRMASNQRCCAAWCTAKGTRFLIPRTSPKPNEYVSPTLCNVQF